MPDKDRERRYLDHLRTVLADFPQGEQQEEEPPDFIIRSERGAIGIELTAFYLPPVTGRPHQEQHSLKDRVTDHACRIHAAAGGPALYVTVFFREPVSVTKRSAPELAEALARAILESPVPPSIHQPALQVSSDRLPDGILAITVYGSVDGRDRLWSAAGGGWVAPIQPEHVEAIIAKKHERLPAARSKCLEVWLVIIYDHFTGGAPAELSETAQLHSYAHRFDRLLWFEPHTPRVRDLARKHA